MRLSAADMLELRAEAGITLRCGETVVRIGKDGIELVGGTVRVAGEKGGISTSKDGIKLSAEKAYMHLGDKLLAKTEEASLSMGKEVKLDGKQILLNSPAQAKDETPPPPPKLTEIELVDQKGKLLAGQRFVIVLDDGSQRVGVTDKDGKASLELPEGARGKIRFPELSEVIEV